MWIASIWFGFGLVDAMQTVFVMRAEGMHHAWVRLFVTTMLSWLPWAVVDSVCAAAGPSISSGEVAAGDDVGGTSWRLRCYRADLLGVDDVAGFVG